MSRRIKRITGVSFSPMFLLFVVFLTLKLTETSPVADWSYWWVTAPIWIPIAIAFAMVFVWFILIIFIGLITLILDLVL